MKTIIKSFIILAAGFSFSCSDLLDVQPTTFVSDEVIWEDKNLIDQFVANIYGNMICGFTRCTYGYIQAWSSGWSGNLDASTDDYACVSGSPIYIIMQKRGYYGPELSVRTGNMDHQLPGNP
ncbi:MAG: hypothetical protein LIP05_00695 [Tannerellaceae bacterium]|nr:hypothetical protein [Tannerellaceae bacterium]